MTSPPRGNSQFTKQTAFILPNVLLQPLGYVDLAQQLKSKGDELAMGVQLPAVGLKAKFCLTAQIT